jgi:hypothetical protein
VPGSRRAFAWHAGILNTAIFKPNWGKQPSAMARPLSRRKWHVRLNLITAIGIQHAMRHLAKNLRRRAAIMIAVAYAFCLLAPAGALAFAANPAALHCMDNLQAASAPPQSHVVAHEHAGSVEHQHGQSKAADHHSNKDGNPAGNCCGLFCVSALAHDPALTFGLSAPGSSAVAVLANGLIGRAPTPLHRPPIA